MFNYIFNNSRKILINIFVFLSYFVYQYLFVFIMAFMNIDYFKLSINNKYLCNFIFNSIYILILLFIYRKELKEEAKDYKENYSNYIKKYFEIYLIGIILMGLSNFLLQKITPTSLSGNEEAVRKLIKLLPVYMTFSTVIFAPIIEEVIFRKIIKNIFGNNVLFVIISGLLFGLLHVTNFKDMNEIIHSIPYIIMGIDFAYIYYKTKNIFTTITFHSFHNLILLSYLSKWRGWWHRFPPEGAHHAAR